MAENFPQIPEALQILSSTSTKKITPRCIKATLVKNKNKFHKQLKTDTLKKQQN